ncbi:schwannomin-interacting protein 1 isoform X2 [Mugil cephalus]|uniref:schwannomin-interacting protein 1 isoform X2 n=1 Tax=Mugil cephalus TaxID=48193 RepID=UPI001FB68792|nr:schwannomin-interacting protein 1 isoform X2 [Mugil cephalus]
MEGEKEKQRQQRGEEKESNEAEDDDVKEEADGYDTDDLGYPIMHWEALSLRIAELEKQEEEEKRKKAKSGFSLERRVAPLSWTEERGRRADSWEDNDDAGNSHVLSLTSRLQTQTNLQLCFINNSESEEEEEEEDRGQTGKTKRGTTQSLQPPAKPEKPKSRGFGNTLRSLRDRLRRDNKALTTVCRDPAVHRKNWELSDLHNSSIKDLNVLCASLNKAIQDLSSELVACLKIRDQLRTKQDAMLLEVQDLTSL